ncbi:hypothetical protein E3P77_04132 [Wallemia ichthyophaga]|uniref:Major facilitator superfamily (MFS) profile domain-containing protein n=1 Tax=Wallemia ichthyophaga TaxID=245174 RepID=A0A4T0KMK2_WALIC|nr:hypothetical protein E3P98_04130 [Wallemia ichthyophaga]TIA94671.1 hypothetical protein E3P95_04137 [Wallemia ichthyophaga]TIA95124.1 hypothetical protein E3P94_04138 [Wallemia ichthyophaga]TIB28221.1 hypothetical protein E3P84_04129 [Wallemia ichthyophaga]TIB28822.1 hypothetical protein E3P86_03794 [Wallemia ichthyophaga]
MGIFNNKQPLGATTVYVSILSSVGGMIFGYDTGQISDMVLMRDFKYRFADIRTNCINGHCEEYEFSNVREGLIVSLLSIGTLSGALLGAPVADYLGRRMAMSLEAALFTVGLIVQIATQFSWEQFAVGRLIAGLGIGALSAVIPVYVSECVVPNFRGSAVACYQLCITFGILLAYCFCYGTRPLDSDASWRIIVGLGIALALILGVGVWFLPESPRWLMKNDKVEQAKRSLQRVRGAKSDFDKAVVEHDFLEIAAKVKLEQQTESSFWKSWVECFIGQPGKKKLVYRTALGVFLQTFNQLTGANYFFYYGATIFQSVGIEDSYITQIVLGAVNFFCTLWGLWILERFGRRKPMIFGGIWQCECKLSLLTVWLMVFATVGDQLDPRPTPSRPEGNPASGKVMILSACLFIASFASTYGPGTWIVTGETFPLSHRARQASIATASNWVWNFLIGFFSPFITSAISFRYGYVFSGCNLCLAAVMYFFLYETAGLSLEAVDEMYSTKGLKPWRSSQWVPSGFINRRDVMEASKIETFHIEHMDGNDERRFSTADGDQSSQTPSESNKKMDV